MMKNLDLEDIVRCWSVNSLFKIVAQEFIAEKNPLLELRHINQIVELMHRIEQHRIQPFTNPLFPPNKFVVRITKSNYKFTVLVNAFWARFGEIATRINIKLDTSVNWGIAGDEANEPDTPSVPCVANILENCCNLETLFIRMRYNVVLPQELVAQLPTVYPKLKRIRLEHIWGLEVTEGEMDLIEFLSERSPSLQNVKLIMGNRFTSADRVHSMNKQLPERLRRIRSRVTVQLWMMLSNLDKDVLLELAVLPSRITCLNCCMIIPFTNLGTFDDILE